MKLTRAMIITLILAMALGLVGCTSVNPPAAPTPTPMPAPLPSPTQEKPKENLITDLAYIKAGGGHYTDDADPEPEGVRINISWWDTKSEMIIFRNIPISVNVELYQRGFDMKAGEYLLGRCIYKGQARIDSALGAIRIPFEDIDATHIQGYHHDTLAKLSIHTPEQGDYSIEGIIAADFGFSED
ncbi:hypothetical protein ES708_20684 [subsurface metagenome]